MTDWFIIVENRVPGSIERVTGAREPKRDDQEIPTEKQVNSTEISGLDKTVTTAEKPKVSRKTRKQVSQARYVQYLDDVDRQAVSQKTAVAPEWKHDTRMSFTLQLSSILGR